MRLGGTCRRQDGDGSLGLGFVSTIIMPHPRLPAELLDYIVDHIHDAGDSLKNCCLTSSSWVPRTRKHLFTNVKFRGRNDLQSWKNTFPDPSTSPACYTKNLVIWSPGEVIVADAECGWILAFSYVEHFGLCLSGGETSFLPFHGFSPVLKSISFTHIHSPFSQVIGLIHSFPLIESLSLIMMKNGQIEDIGRQPTAVQPPFTGTLHILVQYGMRSTISRLFPLQNDLHFRELDLGLWYDDDISVVSTLVRRCYFTLESLKVGSWYGASV